MLKFVWLEHVDEAIRAALVEPGAAAAGEASSRRAAT
jgi:hypothetical protein